MLALLGLLVGALLGHLVWGDWGAALGGLAGFFGGALLASHRQRDAFRKPLAIATTALPMPSESTASRAAIELRLAALERRMAQLEAEARGAIDAQPSGANVATATTAIGNETPAAAAAGHAVASAMPSAVRAAAADSSDASVGAQRVTAGVAPAQLSAARISPDTQAPPLAEFPGAAVPSPSRAQSAVSQRLQNALWAWFTGGNAMTRIGVVVLFFGVGFLLRYFAEHFTLSIEIKLLAIAAAGAALVVAGWRSARTRPAYGWSLQGAGMGVLYLTAFAALHEFGVLQAGTALALLAAIAALTAWLALMADGEALAGLALAGAFLAPMLTGIDHDPLPLFAYFAVVNLAVLMIAWYRTWRAVNLLGFAFTFVLALAWGHAYYRPQHFAMVQPFLLLFFLLYVAVAMLQARHRAPQPTQPLDGLLIFGVPLVGFALQAALVGDMRFGAAWSALAVAAIYAVLALALRRQSDPRWTLLARSFAGLAVVFATLAIPFALDNRWTAAVWSVEAALVFWLGVQQGSAPGRMFALALQVAAGLIFVASGVAGGNDRDHLFLNAYFIGTMLIAIAGLVTAWLADRGVVALTARERGLVPWIFAWGAVWWLGGGSAELVRELPRAPEAHAVLAWFAASAGTALLLRRPLAWPRLAALAFALPLAMAVVALRDLERAHTTLLQAGWLVWPLAWVVHLRSLWVADEMTGNFPAANPRPLPVWRDGAHTLTALAITAHIAWEASEWVGRVTAADTVWVACAAALPGIAYLWLAPRLRNGVAWPFQRYGRAYVLGAGTPMAVLLALWILAVNVLSPGEPYPLPYAPLFNPLDLTLACALLVLFAWAGAHPALDERSRFTGLGIGLFMSINGGMLRAAHHWGGIPWDLPALTDSRPLQATLTLAWTLTGVTLMFVAAKRRVRPLWMVGAALLALVVAKLFLVDLRTLSGLPRVVAFMGVGSLLLLIGYLSPLPPAARGEDAPMR